MNEAAAEIAFMVFLQRDTMNARQRVAGDLLGGSNQDVTAAEIRCLAFMGIASDFWNFYDQAPKPSCLNEPSL